MSNKLVDKESKNIDNIPDELYHEVAKMDVGLSNTNIFKISKTGQNVYICPVGNKTFTITAEEELLAFDLRVYSHLLSLANDPEKIEIIEERFDKIKAKMNKNKKNNDKDNSKVHEQEKKKMELTGTGFSIKKPELLAINGITKYEFLTYMNLDPSGENYNKVIKSLNKLYNTKIEVTEVNEDFKCNYKMHLLSWCELEYIKTGKKILFITLDPFTSKIFLGESNFIAYNIKEQKQLHKDASIILHNFLSVRINQGKSAIFTMDNLIESAWKWDKDSNIPEVRNGRKRIILRALKEINELDDWKIEVLDKRKEHFRIQHYKRKEKLQAIEI
jgi:hypothetical protein